MKFYPGKFVPEDVLVEMINHAYEELGGYDSLEFGAKVTAEGEAWHRIPYDFYVGSFMPCDAEKFNLERLGRDLGVLRRGQRVVAKVKHRRALVKLRPYSKRAADRVQMNLDFEVTAT